MTKQIAIQSKFKGYTVSKGGGSNVNRDYVMPRIYSLLAKQYKTITVGDTVLDFQIDDLLAKHPEYKIFTKPDRFLVGVKDKQPLTIDSYGNLFQGDTELQPVEELLGIPMRKAPLEHAVINISGFPFPLGVVLCYYFGIDALLKAIKATTRVVPIGTRPKLSDDEYAIKFNDEYLIFNRREKLTTMIFGGMPDLNNISNFSRSDLNNKGIWHALMGDPKVRPSMFQEMQNLYDLFIDPISRDELKKMKLSESFHWLLIDAAKALETDYSRHEVEIEEQRIAGYERFAGHIYTELSRAIRQHRNKGKARKHKLDFNPDAVIQNISKDRSVNLVEEVNPVHQVKDQEEVTFGGDGGRSEITMVKRARTQLPSYKGKISEANKDSSKVGFVTYLTSDPAIADFRGNVELNHKRTPTGDGSVTMNLQYGGTHDDPKRASFTSTQASQAVSATNYQINTLRTGYENVLAHRTSELYSKVAAQDGKVVEVVDDCLTVEYKDGTKDKYPLGLVVGEAAGEYHRHTRVTDLKVGDKFQKGDIVGWDSTWFARDPFCPGQVAWLAGKMVRIAMVEDQDVYEDSIAISKELAQEARTPFLKVNRFPIEVENNLIMKVKVGDEIEQDAILCNIEEAHLGAGEDASELEDELNKYGIKQIRAKHHGRIVAIEVRYNSPTDNMSESVKAFIAKRDKETKRKGEVEGTGITSNAINTAFNVNRPTIAPGKAYIAICIESLDPSTNADKYVLGNQMKATVGRIMDRVMKTKSGMVIDIKASFKGMFNRMVLSLRNKLVANEYSYQITQKAIKAYRGK
ncbi:DNA-directed RNA polymerase subunit beta [compost metagenome]